MFITLRNFINLSYSPAERDKIQKLRIFFEYNFMYIYNFFLFFCVWWILLQFRFL